MIKKLILPIITLYTLTYATTDIWKADMSVKKVSHTINNLNYTCLTDISNNKDDDAHNAEVIIMLPLNTKYIDFKITKFQDGNKTTHEINCSKSLQHNQNIQSAYVKCSIGQLGVDSNVSIELKAQFMDINRTNKDDSCSAFVFSISPDGNLKNNYRQSK